MKTCNHDYTNVAFDLQLFAEGDDPPTGESSQTGDSAPPLNGTPSTDTTLLGGDESTATGETTLLGGEDSKPSNYIGAPDTDYGDFTMPEGSTIDTEVMTEFTALAKEMNLSKDGAQKLIDLQTQFASKQAQSAMDQWKTTTDKWQQDTIQALGKGYKQELAFASKAMNEFLDPSEVQEFKQIMNDTKMGNHPLLNKMMVKMGKLLASPDSLHGRTDPVTKPDINTKEQFASEMFPKT